jgi:hypothetical protein
MAVACLRLSKRGGAWLQRAELVPWEEGWAVDSGVEVLADNMRRAELVPWEEVWAVAVAVAWSAEGDFGC